MVNDVAPVDNSEIVQRHQCGECCYIGWNDDFDVPHRGVGVHSVRELVGRFDKANSCDICNWNDFVHNCGRGVFVLVVQEDEIHHFIGGARLRLELLGRRLHYSAGLSQFGLVLVWLSLFFFAKKKTCVYLPVFFFYFFFFSFSFFFWFFSFFFFLFYFFFFYFAYFIHINF